MHKFRIAIIIPVYNREQYVLEALESLTTQKRLPDEIIVVDDGSTDGSVDVVKNWQPTRGPQVTLIEQENQGASTAMNVAIQNADADLIAPLDSDDAFLPGHLERLESAFKRHPDLAVCSGNSGRLDKLPHFKRMGFENSVFDDMEYDEEQDGLRIIRGSAYRIMLKGAFIPTCSTLFSKKKAEQAGLYDESMRTCYDTDFWLRMSKQGRFAFFMEKISLVRKHDDNLTHRRHIVSQIMSYIETYEKMLSEVDTLQLTPNETEATKQMLAQRVSGATNRASRYGLRPYLSVSQRLISRGHFSPLFRPKALLRALMRPRGDQSKI